MANNDISQLKRKADGLLESCLSQNKYDCILGFLEFQLMKNPIVATELILHTRQNLISEIEFTNERISEKQGSIRVAGKSELQNRLALLKEALAEIKLI